MYAVIFTLTGDDHYRLAESILDSTTATVKYFDTPADAERYVRKLVSEDLFVPAIQGLARPNLLAVSEEQEEKQQYNLNKHHITRWCVQSHA